MQMEWLRIWNGTPGVSARVRKQFTHYLTHMKALPDPSSAVRRVVFGTFTVAFPIAR